MKTYEVGAINEAFADSADRPTGRRADGPTGRRADGPTGRRADGPTIKPVVVF
ncbi:hypothetical protein [Streptomyces sp. P9-A2]|uniref:hypothetical protein n=1 Tax=Streptomyces sp. P9-A2 TaxID=3072284 RepID=UPI002FCB7A22